MATALFNELFKRFSLGGVDIDNLTFKLFSRVSVGIFIVASAASICGEYSGSAIKCKGGDDHGWAEQYCWLHGTYKIEAKKLSLAVAEGCYRNTENFYPNQDDTSPDTEYYMWVSLMLFLHGALFMIPDKLWKHSEGGLLKQFGSDRNDFAENASKDATLFKDLSKNRTRRYFFTFMAFECFNFIIALFNFFVIDKFLSGHFLTYGLDVLTYYGQEHALEDVNPMCSCFPTVVNCVTYSGGTGKGSVDKKSILCNLGQNIVNQKIYLVLWIWFVVLFTASGIMIIYRILGFILPTFQRMEIQSYIRSSKNDSVKSLKLDYNHIGHRFVLGQIGRNSTPYNFRAFLDEVAFLNKRIKPEKVKETNAANAIEMK